MSPPDNRGEQFVQKMFDRIARRYDLLNRVISFHLDTVWRKRLTAALGLAGKDLLVLDLGTGTGDLALSAAEEAGKNGKIVGLDFSLEMLRLAQAKKSKLSSGAKTSYVLGTALASPFKKESFDAAVSAFVSRNIRDLNLFFDETYRVLKPGGRVAFLDMFPPRRGLFSLLYSLYFYRLVPWIGARLARDRAAYQYLSDSVKGFHSPEAMARMIQEAGFEKVRVKRFLLGAVCLHLGERPARG